MNLNANDLNHHHPNINYELPPIRKIGPAVLPKPKNIKIQAGRVIRIQNEEPFLLKYQSENQHFECPLPPPPPDLLYESSDLYVNRPPEQQNIRVRDDKPQPIPHRAKLIQIPDDNNNYESYTSSSMSDFTHNSNTDSSDSTIPVHNFNQFISTSQYKFPRKSKENTTKSGPTSPRDQNNQLSPILSSKTIRINGINNSNPPPTTINVSADGPSNRPMITITTTRNPNSSDFNASPAGLTYNIPIQHVNKSQSSSSSFHNQRLPHSMRNNLLISSHDHDNNSIDNNESNSFTIPVNLKLSSDNNNSENSAQNANFNKNNFNLNLTNNLNNLTSSGNFNTQPKLNMNNGTIIFENGNSSLKNFPSNNINNKIEDQVDMLKELLMKNLNSSNDSNFYGVCKKCNEGIIGIENGLRAMDGLFHVECFCCHGCGISLQDKHFYALDNKTLCEKCYNKLLERCHLCSKPISDRILRATGKPFHPECFCCIVCQKNLDGIPFTVDASNKIHCIECFHEKYAPRCHVCHLPITPEHGQEETVRIVAMDKNFHVNCYKCEDCDVSLTSSAESGGGCFPLDDHIYCKNCNIKRIKNLNAQGLFSQLTKSALNQVSNLTPRSTDL